MSGQNKIKLLILDRDGLINVGSSYYVTKPENFIFKRGAVKALSLIQAWAKNSQCSVVLATKQRCISKGLIDLAGVKKINSLIPFDFDSVYIEQNLPNKQKLIQGILEDFAVSPEYALLIDDSHEECFLAQDLGVNTIHSRSLETAFKILESKYNLQD